MTDKNPNLRTILIADDDDDTRQMLSFLLEQEGWHVSEACDGKEALTKVLQDNPDVLVLDNRMPELTGAEVYQRLKAEQIKTRVILATAYGDVAELAQALNIQYFLAKPFDIPDLLECIETAYSDLLLADS